MAQLHDAPTANPAELYERVFVPALSMPLAQDLLRRAAPKRGERVLDVACGTGTVARLAAPRVAPNGHVVGVDPMPAMLAVARGVAAAEGVEIEWREGRGEALPVDDAAFDLVCCQQGLQFFEDRAAGLREMHRALVPEGRVVVSVGQGIERQTFPAALDEVTERHLGTPVFARTIFSLGDADELRALLERSGFRDVTIEPLSVTAHTPDPAGFVRLLLRGPAMMNPVVAGMDPTARETAFGAVLADAESVARPYLEDGVLVFTAHTHIAQARA